MTTLLKSPPAPAARRRCAPALALAVLLAVSATAPAAEKKAAPAGGADLKPIFNGKDLSGWKVPADNIWWKVEDGELQVRSGPEKKGSTLWTEREFKDFEIEVEFRFGPGTVDSGIYLRNSREQIQIGISGSLKRDMTASPYISGKRYPVEAEGVKELLKLEGWNKLRVRAAGKTYTAWLNGKKVMTYTSESAPASGPVGLQLHGNRDMAIDFRNLRLAELP